MSRTTLPRLQLLKSKNPWAERTEILSQFVAGKFADSKAPVKALEAGCGRSWPLDLNGIALEIAGVDMDAAALESRKREVGDLHRAIVGDLRKVDFEPEEFDLIYCCEVLEHIRGAEEVLLRFMRWLKPRGVAILIFPDRNTVFGLATRSSPHWLHVAYHRYVLGMSHAGETGYPPYRTYYDPIISRRGIHSFCAEYHCHVALEYGRPPGPADWPRWFLRPYQLVAPVISAISGGAIASSHIGLVYALEKR